MTESSIVITSIYPPTTAVEKYAIMASSRLIVVGDKKTPIEWSYPDVYFVGADIHDQLGFSISSVLPYNHYSRKMIGYLLAARSGAGVIIDTDDDNIPQDNYGFPPFEGNFKMIKTGLGFVNIYQLFTHQHIWPRGLPLNHILSKATSSEILENEFNRVGVWQGLADEDPDVDAIYRLTSNKPCYFEIKDEIVLGRATISPFNSQNTAFRKELFPLLYLPSTVTFRFTDILRGLVAQPIMWQMGYCLGITNATVLQKRNEHNLMHDFHDEIPVFLHAEKVIEVVQKAILPNATLAANMLLAYKALHAAEIVREKELDVLKSWLADIGQFCPEAMPNELPKT